MKRVIKDVGRRFDKNKDWNNSSSSAIPLIMRRGGECDSVDVLSFPSRQSHSHCIISWPLKLNVCIQRFYSLNISCNNALLGPL